MATPSLEFIPLSEQIERLSEQTESPINISAALAAPTLKPLEALPVDAPVMSGASVSNIEKLRQDLEKLRSSEANRLTTSAVTMPDFDTDYKDYKTRFEAILSRPQELGFYDLVSDLGAAMLATDPTVGPFRAAGVGFVNFNERSRARKEAIRKLNQQAATTAFELAQANQDRAQEYLNKRELSNIEARNKNPKMVNYRIEERDASGKVVGSADIPINENNKFELDLVRDMGGVRNPTPQNKISIGSGSNKFADLRADSLSAEIDAMNEQAKAAAETTMRLQMVRQAAERIGYDVGAIAASTKGIRGFLADAGIINYGNLSDQELISTLNTQLALGLTALTKGPISDREMFDFKTAMPGLGNTADGLRKQIGYMLGMAAYQQKYFDDYANDQKLQSMLADPEINAITKDNEFAKWQINWRKNNQLTSTDGTVFTINQLVSELKDKAPIETAETRAKALKAAQAAQSSSFPI